jgi:hypothetical protein
MDNKISVNVSIREQSTSSLAVLTSCVNQSSVDMNNLETALNSPPPVLNVKKDGVELKAPVSFNAIPPEVRIKIWNHVMMPRVVKVCVTTTGYVKTRSGNNKHTLKRFSSNLQVPVILQICQESRTEGLKMYTLCFGTHQEADKPEFKFSYTARAKTYFSYALDTVHFVITDRESSIDAYHLVPLKYMSLADKDNIRSVSTTFWEELFKLSPKLISFWRAEQLKSLEEIVLPAKLYDGKIEFNSRYGVQEIPGNSDEEDCTVRNQLIQAARIRPEFCQKMWSMRFVARAQFNNMLAAAKHY